MLGFNVSTTRIMLKISIRSLNKYLNWKSSNVPTRTREKFELYVRTLKKLEIFPVFESTLVIGMRV